MISSAVFVGLKQNILDNFDIGIYHATSLRVYSSCARLVEQ